MPRTIIIIEDDVDILDMMSYILKDEGYNVISSVDCKPLEQVMNIKPDLILLDNRLHQGSGRDECRKLKEAAATRHIPVIIVSANMDLAQLAVDSQADGYINKPFDLEEFVAVVSRFVGS